MAAVRVATYNILHGMTLDNAATDPQRLADAAAATEAHVLGLQEVDVDQARSGEVDQTAVVSRALGARWHAFVPALYGTPGLERSWQPATSLDGSYATNWSANGGPRPRYGIALVSRLPVVRWAVKRFNGVRIRLPLAAPGEGGWRFMLVPDEPRIALAAVVEGPSGPFTVVTTHLSFVPGVNAAQLRAIAGWAEPMPGPVILLGDLNLPGTVPARLTGWEPLVTTETYPSPAPRVQLDHVLGRRLPADAKLGEHVWLGPVSDHRATGVDLNL
jgi:endonuclease/exonuclease/phosphatase family metal-dependent hydrolase